MAGQGGEYMDRLPIVTSLKVDEVGRIYFPAWLRESIGLTPGKIFEVYKTDAPGELLLKKTGGEKDDN